MTDVPSWATPVQKETSSVPEWATPAQTTAVPEWAQPVQQTTTVKQKNYTQNDLSENSDLYNPIARYMKDRFGLQAVEHKSREDIVDMFLNERRGNAAGNFVRLGSNIDYLSDIKEDPNRLKIAGDAYGIYEGMSGIFSDDATWGETGEGVKDFVRTTLFDPINLVGGALGKIAGGTTIRTGASVVEKSAQKEVARQLMKGATREAAEKVGAEVLRQSIKQASKESTQEIAEFTVKLSATKGFDRVLTRAGLAEVGTATFADAIINAGAETLYQRSLVQTGVKDEVDKYSVGLAALGSLALGGVQALRVANRGRSGTALLTETVQKTSNAQVAKELKQSLAAYLKKGELKETSWAKKVAKGEELTDADSDFFIDLLLGVSDDEGNTLLKGLAQTMQEGGHFYVKRSEDDKISNWLSDFLREMDQDSINDIIDGVQTGLGREIDGLSNMTPDDFANAFAKKINSSARNMNSVMQVAKRMDTSIKEMKLKDFMDTALEFDDIKVPGLDKKKWDSSGPITANITETQNKFIRSLVSHPATSALNVVGYATAAGIDTGSDILMALYKGGRGTLRSIVGMKKGGMNDLFISKQLLLASKDRLKFALDPDMTYAAYKSAMERQTGALGQLNRTLSGGVDVSYSMKASSSLGGIGGKIQNTADTYISGIQTATFVHAQDAVTKSQEYVSQMNKSLRTTFGKSWNEFYSNPDAIKIMATKEYKQMEANAVSKVLENTFSKSYKGKNPLGEVAGFIEDARNIPGLGFMVPFGRFFNNTIDFGVKNTPASFLAKGLAGKYKDVELTELIARSAVTTGLIYSLAQNEDEKRRQGLGLYESVDPVSGEVFNQQYDYPLSMFIAAGRLLSYNMSGEDVPEDILEQIGKDFFGGSLTRNLTDTSNIVIEMGAAVLAGEMEQAGKSGLKLSADIGSQAISGFLRHLEPLDSAVGMATGRDQRPRDTAQGNKFVGDSFRYIDNTIAMLTGEVDPLKVSSYAGVMDAQTTKNLGIRTVRLTNTQRLMNMVGENQWMINSGLAKEKRLIIPEAVNEYQRLVFESAEEWATKKMENPEFRGLPTKQQSLLWKEELSRIKEGARFLLIARYDGPQSTLGFQYNLMSDFNLKDIEEGIEELGLEKTIGELTKFELATLETRLKAKEKQLRLSIPSSAN